MIYLHLYYENTILAQALNIPQAVLSLPFLRVSTTIISILSRYLHLYIHVTLRHSHRLGHRHLLLSIDKMFGVLRNYYKTC